MSVILDGLVRDLKDAAYTLDFSGQDLSSEDLLILTEKINKLIYYTELIFVRLEKK